MVEQKKKKRIGTRFMSRISKYQLKMNFLEWRKAGAIALQGPSRPNAGFLEGHGAGPSQRVNAPCPPRAAPALSVPSQIRWELVQWCEVGMRERAGDGGCWVGVVIAFPCCS